MEEEIKYDYAPLPEPIPITEQEWPDNILPILHTRTMTFMHEKYIRECIEGVLIQKTTFPVQVLIHDDASTDKTAEIVREYEEKYPRLIKAFYQKENSYLKPDKHKRRSEFSKWRIGKYEALCEGDDYWTDPLKLQKQVNQLEKNSQCDLCFHPVIKKHVDYRAPDEIMANHFNQDYIVPVRNVILGEAPYCPTASIVFRRTSITNDLYKNYKLSGSYFLKVFSSMRGGAIYINNTMAVYRKMSAGSWSERERTDPEFFISHHSQFLEMLKHANNLTGKKFDAEFNYLLQKRYDTVLGSRKAPAHLKQDFFKNNKDDINLKTRLKWRFVYQFDLVHRIYGIIKFLFK